MWYIWKRFCLTKIVLNKKFFQLREKRRSLITDDRMGVILKLFRRRIFSLLLLLAHCYDTVKVGYNYHNFMVLKKATCKRPYNFDSRNYISCSYYKEIPRDIPDAFKIQELDMSSQNALYTLTKGELAKANLISLTRLYLYNCRIRAIEKGAFSTKNTVLEYLDLKNNGIEVLDPDVFAGLTKLKTLSLNYNPIKTFATDKVFPTGLPNLANLYMSNCRLVSLPEKAFDNLRLESLYLNDNYLKTVSWRTFHNMNTLTSLTLHRNPWHCDCHIKFLISTLREKHLLNKLTYTSCATSQPNVSLAGVSWSDANSEDLICGPQIDKLVYGNYDAHSQLGSNNHPVDKKGQVNLSQGVYFECSYSGNPQPHISWLKDGIEITFEKHDSAAIGELFQLTNSRPGNHSANLSKMEIFENTDKIFKIADKYEKEKNYRFSELLIVSKLREEDRGLYTCRVTNAAGNVKKTVVLYFTVPSVKENGKKSEIKYGDDRKEILWICVAGVISIFLVIAIVLWLKFVRYVKCMQPSQRDTEENIPLNEQITHTNEFHFDQQHELNILSDLFIDIDCILGKGNFGTVYKGRARGKDVAIKRINNNNSPSASINSLISELKVLSFIGSHKNVVRFIGAYTKEVSKGILYIVTELCTKGCLQDFLRAKTHVLLPRTNAYLNLQGGQFVDFKDLCRFSLEIASGMEYIESKKVVHGDLSARNVLLDAENICKIGDFGLARKLYEYQEYVKTSQEPLPWKWMAYESLTKMEFTTKSDIWSYGVTLWEIFSLGNVPFAGLHWTPDFADELLNGLRLPVPKHATNDIYAKMLECWKVDPEERPLFPELVKLFRNFKKTHDGSSK